MDYWRAAWGTMWEHPLTGTGPGTFSVAYRRVKPPEAEMARLAHNDYLEQGSDSGLVGVVLYVGTVFGVIGWLYGRCREDKLRHGAWLGLLGWGLQGMTEFGLYIPALGWMAFLVMGWLWGEAVGAARTGKRVTDGCGVNINAR
jgi:O-antigen ligase